LWFPFLDADDVIEVDVVDVSSMRLFVRTLQVYANEAMLRSKMCHEIRMTFVMGMAERMKPYAI